MTIVRTVITRLAGASIAFAVEIGRAAEQMCPASAIRKSRLATQCHTADQLQLTASSAKPKLPISICSTNKAA